MDEVKLALELNKVVHNECKDVPRDIGLRLLEVVKKHAGEQRFADKRRQRSRNE